ncbi:MAG: putative rane protein [Parachlamydiales bacterium]|nr:putative rane protein [Parachlamydiales bacterium]
MFQRSKQCNNTGDVIAILSTAAQFATIRAFHHASPTALGPFNYCSVVYAGLLDWGLYGVQPDLWSWIGIILICLGGIWAIRQGTATLPPLVPTDKAVLK